MFDRKALSASLHALHKSDLKAGANGAILKEAVGKILDAIEAAPGGLTEDDGRHLEEAIDALSDDWVFLARSSILLILEGQPARSWPGHKPALSIAQLRERLNAIR